METPTNTSSAVTAATPASAVSSGSRPFDERSQTTSPALQSPPASTMMLAPTIQASPDRDRTLLEEEASSSKSTPETAQGPSKDEEDLEEGTKLFSSQEESKGTQDDADAASTDPKKNRKKLLCFCVGISICIVISAGFLGYVFLRNNGTRKNAAEANRPVTLEPTKAPTNSPTRTRAPTLNPTVSFAPTTTVLPSASPSTAPTVRPSASPSAGPTLSSVPTISPSAAPTRDLINLLQDFFSGTYGVSLDESSVANNLAIEWLAEEGNSMTRDSFALDGKLAQRFALLTMDLSLQDAQVSGDAPNNAEMGVDVCDWKGIRCNSEGWVEMILWGFQPKGNHGSGTISGAVRLLVGSLKILDLSNNGLVGKIPEALYKLTNLERLYLFKNQLTGTISSKIGDFDSITHFHLSHNELSGTIPDELKSDADGIRPLQYFNLYSNKLTGTLPQSMRLRNCIYFDVGRNKLTGTLPVDLGEKFVALRMLHLDHNEFRGTLPESYNTVGNGRLEAFSIDNNILTGEIPGKRDLYNKLVQFTFHSNLFSSMDSDNCKMEVPQGEMVEMRGDCNICRCDGYFGLCAYQCPRG